MGRPFLCRENGPVGPTCLDSSFHIRMSLCVATSRTVKYRSCCIYSRATDTRAFQLLISILSPFDSHSHLPKFLALFSFPLITIPLGMMPPSRTGYCSTLLFITCQVGSCGHISFFLIPVSLLFSLSPPVVSSIPFDHPLAASHLTVSPYI